MAICRGYASLVKRGAVVVGTTVILLAGLAAVSMAVVYPLWYLATNHRNIYSCLVLGVIATVIVGTIVLRIRANGGQSRIGFGHIGTIAMKILVAGVIGTAVYAVAVLFTYSIPAGFAGGLTLLIIIGFLLYGRIRS